MLDRFSRLLAAGLAMAIFAQAGVAATSTTPAPDPARLRAPTRYDTEYPVIAYSGPATHNRVWDMQQKLESGALTFTWEPHFGYLRSLLKALDINQDSQVLVFSRTSLQVEHISGHAPRAVYFNDDTYVGYVQNSTLIELATIDSEKGAVFYAFDNEKGGAPTHMEREGGRCLTCHDTFSMMGGGVPRLMELSAPVDDPTDTRTYSSADETDDRTPLAQRWGGWFVTGDTGTQTHFGNLPLREEPSNDILRKLRGKRLNIPDVKAYLDTSHWLTDKSDVVALLVLEHQTYVQNLITRVDFKVRTIISREGDASGAGESASQAPRTWQDVSPTDQKRLRQMMEPLVRALFFQGAAPYGSPIKGGSGFAERFAEAGPKDSKGRSLRELDLNTRLLRHPLSYEIYSAQFDALPQYALEYIYSRIAEILQGRDTTGISAAIPAGERELIRQILIQTKPAIAPLLGQG